MRIVGLDLSMTATGICMPDGSTALIKPKGRGDARLLFIEERITTALRVARPDLAVVEDIRAGLLGDSARVIPMVHAVALLCLMHARVPHAYVNASTLKVYATGGGGSDKDAMALAARELAGRTFPGDKGGDQCDAFWLRAAGHAAYGSPVVEVPKAQTEALSKVAWPRVGATAAVLEFKPKARPKRRRKVAA